MRKLVGAVVLVWCVLIAASGCSDDKQQAVGGEGAGDGGSVSLGPDLAEKPEGWPEDITLPPDTRITANLVEEASEGRTRRTVNTETLLSPEDAHAYYADILADWTDEGGTTVGNTIAGLWILGERSVSTTADDSGDVTKLTVTVTER
ncbi:hypothetical protein ACFQ0K_09850 [Nocardioides caeni]|uniref:Uncharacterized protein n=1 Tax=Nocardioides caeni TaxID=574700 RepID=A0A4S8N949_9ACTN|nr:hypothetical protein [Nocardioides caeni]THV11224.1 hypothetical protein E9934_13110 [Nocardioides caeni]